MSTSYPSGSLPQILGMIGTPEVLRDPSLAGMAAPLPAVAAEMICSAQVNSAFCPQVAAEWMPNFRFAPPGPSLTLHPRALPCQARWQETFVPKWYAAWNAIT
jgi:hypothetical protein